MDYTSFDKPKLWLNIAVFVLCCVMVGFLCFEGEDGRQDLFGMLLFGIFAVNSLFRVYSYFKLDRIRKSAADEKELVRAERRQGLVISIFSNAMFLLLLLLFLIMSITKSLSVGFFIFCAAILLFMSWTLVLSVRNLKKFDRLGVRRDDEQ